MSGGIFLRNGSNFRGDLSYAWEVAGVGADAARKTDFRHNNEIFLPLRESGIYEIRAITRQQSDGVTRVTPILTVSYDAGLDRVVIEEALECVTVE